MRSNPARRRPRTAVRNVVITALVALGIGLVPAPVRASEPQATPSTTNDSPSGTAEGAGTAEPLPEADPPTLLTALASAHEASVALGLTDLDPTRLHRWIMPEEYARAREALDDVGEFLRQPPDLEPGVTVDTTELEAQVEELRQWIKDGGPVEEAVDRTEKLRQIAQPIVDDLTAWALSAIDEAVAGVPTPEELVALAKQLEAFARGFVADTEQVLLYQLDMYLDYLTDPETSRPVRQAVTVVLLAVAHAVNPLPNGLAPTAELVVNASGALLSWAEELARQQAEAAGTSPEQDTDSDEAPPAEDTRVVDSDLVVADEPIAVGAPIRVERPYLPLPATGVGSTGGGDGGQCGGFEGDVCMPPVVTSSGPVIQRPIVRIVLVGSSWAEEDSHLAAALDNLFGSMSGSSYQGILRQYYDFRSGYIGTDVSYQGMHLLDITAPGEVTGVQAARYAARAAREHPAWSTNDSVVWMVMLPRWSQSEGFNHCGYQAAAYSGDRRYNLAVVDYPETEECMPVRGNRRASLTVIAAHEYIGVVTNPQGNGWKDGLGQHLPDLCRAQIVSGPGGERVSQVWSNGDERCVSSFTPRFSYEVNSVTKPDGDRDVAGVANGGYTRGHSYSGAAIEVTNTGTMPWLPSGGKQTYLGTADNACSPFADTTTKVEAQRWANCRRIALPNARAIAAGESHTFVFAMKPDGSLRDDAKGLSETFRMVAGTTWMSNTGGTSARIGGIDLHTFNAVAAAVPTVGVVAVGHPGTDVTVPIALRNTGSATWYPGEVMYLGTETGSRFAATRWPRGPGGCRDCRAHRFAELTPPGAVYTFDLVLHLPVGRVLTATEKFVPFADVRRVADGGVSTKKLTAGEFKVTVVVVPEPVMAHQVAGYGFASGDAEDTVVDESGFSCLALAGEDATTTKITSCTATVTTAFGYAYAAAAPAVTADGRLARTHALWSGYQPGFGDTIEVCWRAVSTFLDGTTGTHTGCTQKE